MEESILKDKKLCECGCGQQIDRFNKWGYERRYTHGHNRRGKVSGRYKGYKQIDRKGYVLRWAPKHHFANSSNYVREHRLVFEETYNCCVLPWADIHHKDGNKQNNSPANLEAMMHDAHSATHDTFGRLRAKGLLKGEKHPMFGRHPIPWNKGLRIANTKTGERNLA